MFHESPALGILATRAYIAGFDFEYWADVFLVSSRRTRASMEDVIAEAHNILRFYTEALASNQTLLYFTVQTRHNRLHIFKAGRFENVAEFLVTAKEEE